MLTKLNVARSSMMIKTYCRATELCIYFNPFEVNIH